MLRGAGHPPPSVCSAYPPLPLHRQRQLLASSQGYRTRKMHRFVHYFSVTSSSPAVWSLPPIQSPARRLTSVLVAGIVSSPETDLCTGSWNQLSANVSPFRPSYSKSKVCWSERSQPKLCIGESILCSVHQCLASVLFNYSGLNVCSGLNYSKP